MAQKIGHLMGRQLSLRIVYLSCLTGAFAGLVAVGFGWGLDFVHHMWMGVWAGYEIPHPAGETSAFVLDQVTRRPWVFFCLPILGGLISGWLVYTFAPEAEGHGTDAVIDAFHTKGGKIRKRVPFVKGLASIVTLASGGSAGREGPIAQVGAGVGTWIADLLHLSPRERRILLLCGAGGGIGAIFRAPLGGALFAAEVLYAEDFETDAIVPCIFSSVVAYSILTLFSGTGSIFGLPPIVFTGWKALSIYLALGAICAGVGAIYVRVFYGMRDHVFHKIPISNKLKPALGGLGVALIGLALPEARGGGYGYLQTAIVGGIALMPALAIAFGKILTTSLTISSGGSGGVFGPSLVIGGMLGAAIGSAAQQVAPDLVPHVAPFALVGMAGLFAGISNAPVSALILVSEMTMGYGLLVPLMLVSVISLTLRKASLYEKQIKNRLASGAHVADFALDIFESLRVKDAWVVKDVVSIREGASMQEMLEVVNRVHHLVYPVVDQNKELVGLLDLQHFHEYLTDPNADHLLIARDLMVPPVSVFPEDLCDTALKRFLESGLTRLPVVDPDQPRKILGMVSHDELTNAYNFELRRRRMMK